MGDTYKKNSNTGIEGIKFQLNLLTVFLLNVLSSSKGWKISTENTEAGKYDDIVLELTDRTVLLQAKYRKNRKVCKAQIISNLKNADFGLAKYFFSYHEIKSNFANKTLIICTNTEINDKGLKDILIPKTVHEDTMLFFEGTNCSIFTFSEKILPELRTSVETYYKNNLEGKGTDKSIITDENMVMFLRNLQIVSSYPSGERLDNVIEHLLRRLSNCSLYCKVSIQEVHKKVEDWFKQEEGEYLTEKRAKSLFAAIKSDQYCEELKNCNVSFKNNNFNVKDSKGNCHITSEGRYVLQLLKIYDALKEDKSKILYVNPDDDVAVQNQVIHAFGLPRYIFLVLIVTKMTETAMKRVCGKLRDVLKKNYKKVILVSEGWNKVLHQINFKDISQIDGSVTFDDLSEDTQKMIVNKKIINFQGRSCSLEELIAQPISNYSNAIDSEILEKLILDKEIKVGTPLTNLEASIFQCYIDRRFKRKYRQMFDSEGNTKTEEEELTESSICDITDKVILIADSTGMGKSTILNKLALSMKEKNSQIWIIKIDLNDYSEAFENLKIAQTDTITVRELLNYRKVTRLENGLERFVFSMNKKVMVMIDGIDEISPDYTWLILKMLSECQRAPNFVKVVVTTRPHMIKQLDDVLNVNPLLLQPLTEQDQTAFLTKYWILNLKLDNEGGKKCEHYARALISRMSFWTKGYRCKESSLASIPLYIRMVAEIFQESIKLNEIPDWEGCKEYLQKNTSELKLPQRMGLKKLFEEFIKKKGDHFVYRGTSNTTSTASKALRFLFRKRLVYHRSIAVEVILSIKECSIFSSYRQRSKNGEQDLLNIGIVQSLEDRFDFLHRTFAEYFFSEILATELQSRNQNVKFQTLVIEKILWKPEFRLIRTFLDSFLQSGLESLPSNIFERYHLFRRDSVFWWKYNHNPIFVLAEEGCVTILQLVLKCIDFKMLNEANVKDISNTCNILHYLKILVRKEGINFKDEQGGTPLHSAAQGGHLEMVQFLVTQGANIGSRNYTGHTALHLAVWGEHLDIVTFLVHEGTDVDVRNTEGRTPLHFAAIRNKFAIVKSLVDSNTQINISDKNGQTALHLAALGGHLQIVEFLVKHGADININDKYGRKALHIAALHGQLNTVKFLLYGDINIRDNDGNTALHLAVLRSQLDTVKLLVVRGLDISIINNDGNAALHLASANGSLDMVSFFVEREVDLYIRSNYGRTALHLAASCGQLNVVRLFAQQDTIDINIIDDNGNTALHLAASNGELETFKFLIESKADFTEDKHGRTSLHLAALTGHLDTIKLLVNADINIDINAKDNDGSTALHLACLGGRLETVRFIVESKGDFNLMDRYGRTELHLAALSGDLETVKYLTEIGIDVNITDRYGRTALHLAERTGKSNIINFFADRR